MRPETLKTIQQGLWSVVNAPGGTGANARINGATIYGKTGSAENVMGRKTHAWFCGYLVTNKPEIVVTVFLENAGGGGAMAAPLTAKIFNYYMGNLEIIKQIAPLPPQFRTAEGIEAEEQEQGIEDSGFLTPETETEPSVSQPQEESNVH